MNPLIPSLPPIVFPTHLPLLLLQLRLLLLPFPTCPMLFFCLYYPLPKLASPSPVEILNRKEMLKRKNWKMDLTSSSPFPLLICPEFFHERSENATPKPSSPLLPQSCILLLIVFPTHPSPMSFVASTYLVSTKPGSDHRSDHRVGSSDRIGFEKTGKSVYRYCSNAYLLFPMYSCIVAKKSRTFIHRSFLSSQTLTEVCFNKRTSASFKGNFRI